MHGGAGNDYFDLGGSDMGWTGGLNNGWDVFDGGADFDVIRVLPTSGYSWTAVQIKSDASFGGMTGIEGIWNMSSGPLYIYFQGSVDFTPITSMSPVTKIYGDAYTNVFKGSSYDENIDGNAGNDTIYGNGGNDTIYGDSQTNALATGDDILNGGAGTNILWGNGGADIFQFDTNGAFDTVKDFVSGTDHISISTALAADYSALTISDNASGYAEIHAGATMITLEGVSSASLSSSDFLFF